MPQDETRYPSPPYQLGFFAAITVEADDIVLDLNGFMLSQSALHALEQRFFACIELSSQPFIKGQGPSTFGAETTCSGVVVRNGLLGLSSHHGIHGVGCSDVLIENLRISNFEIAGIHLNGATRVLVRETSVGPTRRDVPVNAMYSNAKFALPHITALKAETSTIDLWRGNYDLCSCADGACVCVRGVIERLFGAQVERRLRCALDAVRADVGAGRPVGTTHPELSRFFVNPSGTADGSAYGIVLNKKGVAVDGFLTEMPESPTREVALCNVCVEGIVSNLVEVVGVNSACTTEEEEAARTVTKYGASPKVMAGPVGDVFRFRDVTNAKGRYRGNVLSDAQLFIAKHAAEGQGGTTSICPDAIMWASSGTDIRSWMTGDPYYEVFEGDSMAHVNKGNIGLFLQGAVKPSMHAVVVSDVVQHGEASKAEGEAMPHVHPKKTIYGYQGATSRGVVLAATEDAALSAIDVRDVKSLHADAAAIELIGSNEGVIASDLLTCGIRSTRSYPVRIRGLQSLPVSGTCPAQIMTSLVLQSDADTSCGCPFRG